MSTLTAYGYHDGSTRGAIFVAYPSPGNAYAWSNIVSQAGTNHTDFTGDTGTIYGYSRYDTNPDGSSWDIQRSIFIFDTSSLTSSATISDAIFSLNSVSSSGSNANVYTASPASNTDIVNSDHTTYGSTACSSDKSITTGWLDWTLNATGISNISKTGY